jgi:hypothetical protein
MTNQNSDQFGGSGFGGNNFGGGGGFNADPNQPNQPGQGPQFNKDTGTFSQEYRHQPLSARVPEKVAKGVLATGVLVLDSPNEFVIDFMQALARPFAVGARIVLSPMVMEQLVAALRENLARYEQRFGPPPVLPKPPTDRRPTIQEIYDEFKLPDEMMSGAYANAVMVGHTPSEFFMDFITNFFPTSAVSARIYMSAAQMPRTIDALATSLGRFQQRMRQTRQPPPAPPESTQPPEPPPTNGTQV